MMSVTLVWIRVLKGRRPRPRRSPYLYDDENRPAYMRHTEAMFRKFATATLAAMPVTQPETAQYIKDTLDSRSDWTFTKDNVRRMRGTVAKVEHSATWSWVDPATKGDFVQCIADFLAKDKVKGETPFPTPMLMNGNQQRFPVTGP